MLPALYAYVVLAAADPSPAEPAAAVSVSSPDLPSWLSPILSTGLVGVFLLMVLFRVKIMPSYVYDQAKVDWDRQHAEDLKQIEDLKKLLADGNLTYTTLVIPAMTRALDINREYLDQQRQSTADRNALDRIERERDRASSPEERRRRDVGNG